MPGDIETDAVALDRLGVDLLMVAQLMQEARHECFDEENAVVVEVAGHVGEAADLLVLAG